MEKPDYEKTCLPDVLHVTDVAKFLGLHEKTVYTYVREGRIRAIRCGRRNMFALRVRTVPARTSEARQ